jgi:Ricin-type beta-trefoil lectin domain
MKLSNLASLVLLVASIVPGAEAGWEAVAHPRKLSGIVGLCNDDASPVGGCLVVKGENPQPGAALILGNHDLDHGWRIDDYGLFHSALDDKMCMQAGRKAPAVSGTPMWLYRCDRTNPKQQFVYDGVAIKLKGSSGLCVGFQGTTSEVDVDTLILKACSKKGNNWSEDF